MPRNIGFPNSLVGLTSPNAAEAQLELARPGLGLTTRLNRQQAFADLQELAASQSDQNFALGQGELENERMANIFDLLGKDAISWSPFATFRSVGS